ncbi:MAG: hypothetical protein C4567_14275, partial [Deltaproteobacteria bacterium]
MKKRRLALAAFFILMTAILSGPAFADTALTLKPAYGPPTSETKLVGSGFFPQEAVDIYFDDEDMILKVTSEEGDFSYTLEVPDDAQPGEHWITAVGRSSTAAKQAKFTVRASWTQFHRVSSHLGRNLLENVLSSSNVPNLAQAWSFATNHHVDSSPAVCGGKVFIGSWDMHVYALNATTGKSLWNRQFNNAIYSSPAVSGTRVYVGCTDNNVYALNTNTGATTWFFSTGGPVYSSPAVSNGAVYIGS